MNVKLRGTLCGVGAAVFYGTNPLGAMNLYHDGISANSTLFYRFGLAIVMLGVMMLVQRKKFGVTRSELMLLAMLGVFMGSSSSSLFISFNYMDVGIASTLLFVYPVMVAVIMALLFKEKVTAATVISIALALGGIALLNQTSDGSALSTLGVLLVMVSSLTYAVYIVVVNKSRLRMSSVKLTFYVLIFGLLTILGYTFAMGETVQLLTTPHQWLFAAQLALMPTVLSLVLMAIAVKDIDSTPTAILGALECLYSYRIFGCARTDNGCSHRLRLLRRVVHYASCRGHRTHPHRRAAHHRRQADVATTHDGGVHAPGSHDREDMALEVVGLS
ncbi:putative membrane protein [Prevotella sp. CAG:520]|nr:putative membrane protein [Prevotella sp. CAG:520]